MFMLAILALYGLVSMLDETLARDALGLTAKLFSRLATVLLTLIAPAPAQQDDATATTSYFGNSSPGDGTHIKVHDWDLGTTEGGSSGSPPQPSSAARAAAALCTLWRPGWPMRSSPRRRSRHRRDLGRGGAPVVPGGQRSSSRRAPAAPSNGPAVRGFIGSANQNDKNNHFQKSTRLRYVDSRTRLIDEPCDAT